MHWEASERNDVDGIRTPYTQKRATKDKQKRVSVLQLTASELNDADGYARSTSHNTTTERKTRIRVLQEWANTSTTATDYVHPTRAQPTEGKKSRVSVLQEETSELNDVNVPPSST